MKRSQLREFQERIKSDFQKAGIVITDKEAQSLEAADFGLNRYEEIGLGVLVYVNTHRCCAKELAMLPHQICPEHRHPRAGDEPGKEETFRCRWGEVYIHIPGAETLKPLGQVPADKKSTFTVWHEVVLKPGEQFTLPPDTLHWFQAGPEGAVVSEFSTASRDEIDIFTDPEIVRIPVIEEE
ncbi:D-lyxose isomerase [Spirochaetia bacterium]|nr:D-lyxose isomerase [Spirochaetia bacterium]